MNRILLLTVSAFLVTLAAVFFLGVWRTSGFDLVPVPDARPGVGYAITRPSGDGSGLELIINVRNQGLDPAPASTTTVRFNGQAPDDLPTGSIAPGDSAPPLMVKVPPTCWSPGSCDFEIELDSRHEISETDENNNKVSGRLLG